MHEDKFKTLILCSLGGALEFFDFIIFALMSIQLSQLFFPTQAPFSALLATFSTFAIGYFARPIGGMVFGHFGDKYGRKQTFTFSVIVMAAATFIIGCIPTYNSIGIYAPLLLIVFRFMQGLSIGGEIPGAITYLSEYWPQRKGLSIGWIFFCIQAGIAFGFFTQYLLTRYLTNEELLAFGWRIPFYLGGVFGCIAYILRKKLAECSNFLPFIAKQTPYPAIYVMKYHKRALIIATLLMAYTGLPLALLFILLPTYLKTITGTYEVDLLSQALAMLSAAIVALVVGYLCDKLTKKIFCWCYAFASILGGLPIFMIYNTHITWFYLAYFISVIVTGLVSGSAPTLLAQLFPKKVRYSGIGISYNIGIGVLTGLIPLIMFSGISYFKEPLFPAYILMFNGILMIVALILLNRKIAFSTLRDITKNI
ncbi:MFS transporter [uncultured Shewanella sp.]|uniref:MFS transporter n=1 Tax=uncultured Shewanella sp. TaxID=173975 RepID=UPI002621E125|nr:MFS transporter [uncultured Shewanella sp.]